MVLLLGLVVVVGGLGLRWVGIRLGLVGMWWWWWWWSWLLLARVGGVGRMLMTRLLYLRLLLRLVREGRWREEGGLWLLASTTSSIIDGGVGSWLGIRIGGLGLRIGGLRLRIGGLGLRIGGLGLRIGGLGLRIGGLGLRTGMGLLPVTLRGPVLPSWSVCMLRVVLRDSWLPVLLRGRSQFFFTLVELGRVPERCGEALIQGHGCGLGHMIIT